MTAFSIDILQPMLTAADDTIHDRIFRGSLASLFLLITTLLPHMLVISLVAFAEILAQVIMKTL